MNRFLRFGIAAVVVGGLLANHAGAHDRFSDVPLSNPHHGSVNAIAAAGVTVGCRTGEYCPESVVPRDQMASFLARTAGLGRNPPIANALPPLATMCEGHRRWPGSFPTSVCGRLVTFGADVFVSGADVGRFNASALGADGAPMVVFLNGDTDQVSLARCTDPLCVEPRVVGALANGAAENRTSIVVGADGVPVVAYTATNGDLRVIRCSGTTCGTTLTNSVFANLAHSPSLALGVDGIPVLSYTDAAGSLRIVRCTTAACTAPTSGVTVPSTGGFNSTTIGSDGRPVVSSSALVSDDASALAVTRCATVVCAVATTQVVENTMGTAETAITVGVGGNPFIVYTENALEDRDLHFVRCSDADCDGAVVVSSGFDLNTRYPSVALDLKGAPVISYYTEDNQNLNVLHCANATCDQPHALYVTADFFGDVGKWTTTLVGLDGVVFTFYNDVTNSQLKLFRNEIQ